MPVRRSGVEASEDHVGCSISVRQGLPPDLAAVPPCFGVDNGNCILAHCAPPDGGLRGKRAPDGGVRA